MILHLRACTVDLDRGQVARSDGDEVALTTREAGLLAYLAERPGQSVSRDELLGEVWGYSDAVLSRACDNTVRRLRTKIEASATQPDHVITVHGTGYRFEPERSDRTAEAPVAVEYGRTLHFAGVSMDVGRHLATGPDGEVPLTAQEVALLERLHAASGAVVDRATLLREIWGTPRGRAVDNAVARLRSKLERDPATPTWLLTERGRGYRVVLPEVARVSDERDAFIGRSDEQRWLAEALSGPGWTVILGPAGVGKTRLCRRAVAGLALPVWWVDAHAATSLEQLCAAVAAVLANPAHDDDPVARLGVALHRRGSGVLVLDNVEQALDATATAVPSWLAAAPALRVVGTSRVRPGLDGERLLPLDVLDADDGLELVRQRAGASSVRLRPGDEPALRQLVQQLDGLPLALELAAARLGALSAEQLLARLDRRLDLLERPRATVDRHRSLRTALQGSWDLLDPRETLAAQVLGSYRGGFDADDVEAVLGPDGIDLLQSLRDASWVHTLPGPELRFSMYESIRAFAAEERAARPDGGRGPELAWATWVSRPGDADPQAVEDLEAAAEVALRWDELEVAARCTIAAASVRQRTGPYRPVLDLVRTVLARGAAPPGLTAWLRLHEGRLIRALDLPGEALEPLRAAADAALAVGDRACEALAAQTLAVCHADRREFELAVGVMARAAEAWEAAGRADLAAYCRGRIELWLGGDADEATRQLQLAISGARGHGDRALEGLAELYLADLAWMRNLPDLAAAGYRRAAEAQRAAGSWELEAHCLSRVMLIQLDLGDHQELEAAAARSLACVAHTGSAVDESLTRAYHATSLLFRGQTDAALEQMRRAREALRGARAVPRTVAYLDLREAQALLALGDRHGARACAERARATFEDLDDRANIPWAESTLSLCLDDDDARRLADRVVATFRELEGVPGLAVALARRSRMLADAGDLDGARADQDEARDLAASAKLGAPGTEAAAALGRGP